MTPCYQISNDIIEFIIKKSPHFLFFFFPFLSCVNPKQMTKEYNLKQEYQKCVTFHLLIQFCNIYPLVCSLGLGLCNNPTYGINGNINVMRGLQESSQARQSVLIYDLTKHGGWLVHKRVHNSLGSSSRSGEVMMGQVGFPKA